LKNDGIYNRLADNSQAKRHWYFAVFCLAISLINIQTLRQLIELANKNEFASLIPIMPFMSAVLIYRNRERIFDCIGCSPNGIICILSAALVIWCDDNISLKAGGIVCMVLGAYLIAYGIQSFKQALFPLMLLFFIIPIPETILHTSIVALQKGSAVGTAMLFKLTGTPYFRDGLTFALPGITIEIAEQCSSIRSSLALLVSSLLASYLMLKSPWRRGVLILLAVPLAMVKNAVRIVTLSLLAIHVDTKYLTNSTLHHDGGILFFVLALGLMAPVLWILRRTERMPRKTRNSTEDTE
jgi:exosortase